MNCEICALDTSADPVMWTCTGCPRKFHAACIGVTVQRGSLRRKERNVVDVNSYVLPCCVSCQELLQAKLEINGLIEQQKILTDQLDKNTEVMHRLASQHQPNAVQEAFESQEKRLEILLTSIQNELSTKIKSSNFADSVVAIRNHNTSLLDTAMKATKENMYDTLKTVTSELSTDLRNIKSELNQINQRSMEIATNCTTNANSLVGNDILDELKSLSANFIYTQNTASLPSTPDPCPSLAVELNNTRNADNSGWRLLGTKKVFKDDWSEYDARKLRRLNQQKSADKARKRRRQNKRRHTSINNNRFNSNYHYAHPINKNHDNYNSSNLNFTRSHNSNNHCNVNIASSQDRENLLPPDRELLAAAKVRFSRPPTNYQPRIQFQRGEILNPYPVSDVLPRSDPAHAPNLMAPESSTAAACAACSCRHSSFLRH